MLNNPTEDATAARLPRLRILSSGKPIAGALSASINQNNYYRADTFRATFAASADVPGWWDVNPPWILDIQISLDGGSWTSLIVGEVDHIQFHPSTGLLSVEGRDLSARLIETKTQEAFPNQTASEIAATIASRHPEITGTSITKTTQLVGRYYETDHSKITAGQFSRSTTEWDLLIYLAQREGFDCFMQGTILHFQPSPDPQSDPFVIQWTPGIVPRMNVVSLSMERSLTIAKDVQVDVRSWSSKAGRGFTKTAKAIGGKSASAAGGKGTTTQKYVIVRPNLTEEQAQKLANQTAIDITKHERTVSVQMPGVLSLAPRNMARLQGTATSFDTVYFIDSIDRSLSFDEGFRMSLRLKNSSPRTQTQV